MSDIWERCAKTLAAITGADASTITEESSPDNLEGWDSLAHVQLILALEKEFAVTIPPDEGVGLENFKMIYEFITARLRQP
jgi:acyl carrier protein